MEAQLEKMTSKGYFVTLLKLRRWVFHSAKTLIGLKNSYLTVQGET